MVRLPTGVVRLARTLELNALHGGSAASPLVIRGAAGGGTVVSGSVPLRPLASPLPPGIAARLPEAARAHARLYRLPPEAVVGPPRDAASACCRSAPRASPLEVYDAEGALVPAHWPREGWAEVRSGSKPPAEPALTVAAPGAPPWSDEPDLWLEGFLRQNWLFERVPVARVEPGTGRIVLGAVPDEGVVQAGARVRIVNALGALDAPGEWWRDPVSGLLVAWPRDPEGRIEVAVTDVLLHLRDASHVRIEAVTLEHARGDALSAEGGEDVALDDSRIAWVGGRGAVFEGVRGGGVERCAVTDTGGTGVRLVGGDRTTLSPSGLRLTGSVIARFGRLTPTQQAGLEIDGVGVDVVGNRFADSSDPGIGIQGNDHRIIGNELSRLLAGADDSGAIYAGRDWTAQGTVIARNVLHDIRADPGLEVKGIYLDDFASGFTIRDNLFLHVDQAVFIGGGRDDVVAHNLFVASNSAIHVDSRGETWAAAAVRDPGSELRLRYSAMPVASPPWRRYRGLARILDDEPQVGKDNRIEDNVFVASRPFDFSDGGDRTRQVVSGNVGPEGIRSAAGPDVQALAEHATDPKAFSDLTDASGRRVGLDLSLPAPGPGVPPALPRPKSL